MDDNYIVTEEERKLFAQMVNSIEPQDDSSHQRGDVGRYIAGERQSSYRHLTVPGRDVEPALAQTRFSYHVTNDSKALKRLLSNKLVEEELDLHGYRLEQAARELSDFMHHAIEQGLRVVRIIHGKGSTHGYSVIKSHMPRWLHSYPEVLAYISCSPGEGGTGAVKVLLRRRGR